MTVTIFRVLPKNPGITDYVSSDEMTARAKAEAMGASLCSREFQLPNKWNIFEMNDEELIYDNLDNPYTVKLHEITDDPAVFTVATVPVFEGLEAVLQPVEE